MGKRKWKRYFAGVLVFMMLVVQWGNVAFSMELTTEAGEASLELHGHDTHADPGPERGGAKPSGEAEKSMDAIIDVSGGGAAPGTAVSGGDIGTEDTAAPGRAACVCKDSLVGFKCTERNYDHIWMFQNCPACAEDIAACAGEKVCTCTEQCGIESGNPLCQVCSLLPAVCEEASACQCGFYDIKCNDRVQSPFCNICLEDPGQCVGRKVCSCDKLCVPGFIKDDNCEVCRDYPEFCSSVSVECICDIYDIRCTAENFNILQLVYGCPACREDLGGCLGKRVCTCEDRCGGMHQDLSCEVCKDRENMIYCSGYDNGCRCRDYNIKCTPQNIDMAGLLCEVCKEDISLCVGRLECTCWVECNIGLPNPSCDVCRFAEGFCSGPSCSCPGDQYVCVLDDANQNCEVCRLDIKRCQYACFCREVKKLLPDRMICTEESAEKWCIVCGERPDKCIFSPETAEDIECQLEHLPDRPVKILWDAALEKTIEITGEAIIELHDSRLRSGSKAAINRDTGCQDTPLFLVKNGGVLTIDGVKLNGSSGWMTSYAPLIRVEEGGSLILKGEASLYDNENLGGNGGAVACLGGSVAMGEDVVIHGNEALIGAGIYLDGDSVLKIDGRSAVMKNKAAEAGGGIYAGAGVQITMAGAPTVGLNEASGKDSNLYLHHDAEEISLAGGLKTGAQVWLTMERDSIFARKDSAVNNRDIRAFHSDEGKYIHAGETYLEMRETPDSVIQGRVLIGKNPVQNALVVVKDRVDGSEVGRTMTGQDGIYRLPEQIQSTAYRVLVSVELDEAYAACMDVEGTRSKSGATFQDILLDKGYCIGGKVTGESVSDVEISAVGLDGKVMCSTLTYGGGWYEAVVRDNCHVKAVGSMEGRTYTGSVKVSVLDADSMTGSDITMGEGGFATGFVRDADGNPVEDATVAFYESKCARDALPEDAVLVSATTTDWGGRFEAPSLKEGNVYQAVVFSGGRKEAAAVTIEIHNGKVEVTAPENEQEINVIRLKEALDISGKVIYFKTIFHSFSWTDDGYPKNLKLVLRLENGMKAAESIIDPEDGSYCLSPVIPGKYVASVVRTDDESVSLSTSGTLFEVNEDGSITLTEEVTLINVNEPEIAPRNVIMVQTKEAIELWVMLTRLERVNCADPDGWIRENIGLINYLNAYLKTDLNSIERDVIPSDLADCLNEWLDYLADRYKVTVSVENHTEDLIGQIKTNLAADGSVEASDMARRIAADVGNQAGLMETGDAQIELMLKTQAARQTGIRAIQNAMVSGEVMGYFDVDFSASFGSEAAGKNGIVKLEEIGEDIRLELSLKDFAYDPEKEYVVVRCHEIDGKQKVEVIDSVFSDGKVAFTTDRFSTYAVAYAMPGKGIIIEVADGSGDEEDDDVTGGGTDGDDDVTGGGTDGDDDVTGGGTDGDDDVTGGGTDGDDNVTGGGTDGGGGSGDDSGHVDADAPKEGEESRGQENGQGVMTVTAKSRYQGDSYNSQYNFWLNVREKILLATDKATIKIDCKDYTLMPSMVIEALEGRDITLVISYDGGEDILLHGSEISAKKGATYYEIELLSELKAVQMQEDAPAVPEDPVQEPQDHTFIKEVPEILEKDDLLDTLQTRNDRSRFILIASLTIFAGAAVVPLVVLKLRKYRL